MVRRYGEGYVMWERFSKALVICVACVAFGFAGMVVIEIPPGYKKVYDYLLLSWFGIGAILSSMTMIPRGSANLGAWIGKCLVFSPVTCVCIWWMFNAAWWIYLFIGVLGVDMH